MPGLSDHWCAVFGHGPGIESLVKRNLVEVKIVDTYRVVGNLRVVHPSLKSVFDGLYAGQVELT